MWIYMCNSKENTPSKNLYLAGERQELRQKVENDFHGHTQNYCVTNGKEKFMIPVVSNLTQYCPCIADRRTRISCNLDGWRPVCTLFLYEQFHTAWARRFGSLLETPRIRLCCRTFEVRWQSACLTCAIAFSLGILDSYELSIASPGQITLHPFACDTSSWKSQVYRIHKNTHHGRGN